MSDALNKIRAWAEITGCGMEFDAILSGKSVEEAIKERHEYMFGPVDTEYKLEQQPESKGGS